jgi:hypothetical protein
VQYVFDKDEHEIDVKKHGNSKGNTPYYQTSHQTKEILKEQCGKEKSPTAIFHENIKNVGGVKNLENAAGHARNVRQVKYVKTSRVEQPSDQIMELNEMLKEGERDKEKAFA